jgi:hypothetical protein
MQIHNTSGYKGVARYKHKWQAYIGANSKFIHLGLFDSKEAAAHAYDQAALQYHGKFARLNFQKEVSTNGR